MLYNLVRHAVVVTIILNTKKYDCLSYLHAVSCCSLIEKYCQRTHVLFVDKLYVSVLSGNFVLRLTTNVDTIFQFNKTI